MKRIYLLFATVLLSLSAMAQDIIVTNDARKIDGKVIEVSKSEIKYKTSDNPDGPLYVLETREINCIIYANGKVELFNNRSEDRMATVDFDSIWDQVVAKAYSMGTLFGSMANGYNDAIGDGQNGNPTGHGSSGGNNWSLAGRNLKGTLPQPSNNFKQEGKVIVEIRVNAAGKVVSATVKGGNISDGQTQQLALEAAKKARFTEGDHDQIGTITYIFKLN